MHRIRFAMMLPMAAMPLAGCVVTTPPPAAPVAVVAPAPAVVAPAPTVVARPARVWVPGHYGPGGRWVPGHWR